MKHLFLLGMLVLSVCTSFGQKLQGVYVGRLFSDRNALILEADGSQVTGAVYVSKKDRFSFAGTYTKPEIKGVILLTGNKKISVEGSLTGKSLALKFPDSSQMKICTVHKVSTKVTLDMADLFSNQYDMLLLGAWETCKETDANGNAIGVAKFIVDYGLHGRGAGRISEGVLPAGTNSALTKIEINWETHDGLLDWTYSFPNLQRDTGTEALTFHHTMNYYFIKNDTLIRKGPKGIFIYFKRRE